MPAAEESAVSDLTNCIAGPSARIQPPPKHEPSQGGSCLPPEMARFIAAVRCRSFAKRPSGTPAGLCSFRSLVEKQKLENMLHPAAPRCTLGQNPHKNKPKSLASRLPVMHPLMHARCTPLHPCRTWQHRGQKKTKFEKDPLQPATIRYTAHLPAENMPKTRTRSLLPSATIRHYPLRSATANAFSLSFYLFFFLPP